MPSEKSKGELFVFGEMWYCLCCRCRDKDVSTHGDKFNTMMLSPLLKIRNSVAFQNSKTSNISMSWIFSFAIQLVSNKEGIFFKTR